VVGRYRIDVVVHGPERRLAVECDGDRWHGEDVWHRDRARQEVLERAGWSFERIRGSAFYRDPEAALAPLWAHLEELGIPTGDEWMDVGLPPTVMEVSGPVDRSVTDPLPSPVSRSASEPVPESAPQPISVARLEPVPVAPLEPEVQPESEPQMFPASFRAWVPTSVPAVASGDTAGIVAGLAAIVAAEGPMHGETVYRRYVQATGGLRVGREIQRTLDQLTLRAVRTGTIERLTDGLTATDEATLYAPGTPAVVVRERGTRTLYEIPRSEIVAVMEHLGLDRADVGATKRAVLEFFGFGRLTAAASTYLDSCLDYAWRP